MIALARSAIRAPRRAAAFGTVAVVLSALAATQLGSGSPERLLARSGSGVGAATIAQERAFGGEPIVVDLAGDIDTTLAPANLAASLRLERRVAKLGGVQTVLGAGTFVDQ